MNFIRRIGFGDGVEIGHSKSITHVVSDYVDECDDKVSDQVDVMRGQITALTNLLGYVVEMLPEEKQIELAEKMSHFPVREPEKKGTRKP